MKISPYSIKLQIINYFKNIWKKAEVAKLQAKFWTLPGFIE
jgi:hypothetical protein